ncbi:PGPGW domain-containing protein [Cellulomonas cellasea]|uniref:PGPGW domain-containing protein n=1 Tax=Cellulomonas cellasea TaxID=43670 RepID=UPI0025A4879C|nr:PGPGW domain-containing protein [Cellulomonas cellasea]MDM8084833.1 PGPGW domain-containing protein [Cellulomonas cellasea]
MNDDARDARAPEGGIPARVRAALSSLPRPVRWVAVAVVGVTLVLAGIAMLVLPGPGWVAIFAGLAVLAAEFTWAAKLLGRMNSVALRLWHMVLGWFGRRPAPQPEPGPDAAEPDASGPNAITGRDTTP